MNINISKKKIEKTKEKIIQVLEKVKKGDIITIDDFCDPEAWNESTDVFDYAIDVREVIRSIISYSIITGDKGVLYKAKVIQSYQKKRINEVTSLQLEELTDRYLDILTKYYDSVSALQLLVDGNIETSLLNRASEVFGFYDKIAMDKIQEYPYYEDRFSAEMIRKTILKDFNYIIDKFENSMDLKLLEVDDSMSKQVIKGCYVLSKVATKAHEESMPMVTDAIMTILKLQWLDQYRKSDYGTGLNIESLFLLQYSYEIIQNKFSGDTFKLFDSFRPERVFENITKYLNK